MKFLNKYFYIVAVLLVGTACEPDLEDILVKADNGNDTEGAIDAAKYVAIGNSLTAGFADGALYEEAQNLSFPNILANQFKDIGGGEFTQPIISGDGFGLEGTAIVGHFQVTKVDRNANPPVEFSRNPDVNSAAAFEEVGTNFNNLGIPGIRVADISFQGYGRNLVDASPGNPYFARLLPDTDQDKTYLEVVAESNPTFFTCWLGNNDVLGYATTGGAAGVDGAPGTFLGGITPSALFKANYTAMISTLMNAGAQGVVITIPNVTDIPYFTTVTPAALRNAIVLDAATAAALNAGYADYNAGVNAWNNAVPESLHRPPLRFNAGNTFPVIVDESLADVPLPTGGFLPKYRFMTEEDLVLLPLPTDQIPLGLGTQMPIPSQYTLTVAEQGFVAEAIADYNAHIISTAVANPGIALWDANEFFSDFVKNGYTESSLVMTNTFVSGGAFSLDGIHATPRGYALVANKIIEAINEHFGVKILGVRLQDYRTVKLAD